MKRILYSVIAIWLLSLPRLNAQTDTIVTPSGELGGSGSEFEFVGESGEIVSFPRLTYAGEILYYPPLVTMDSVPSTCVSGTSITAYANIVFNGWCETVTTQGFQICTCPDFGCSVQTVTVTPEHSYAFCHAPCNHNVYHCTFTGLLPGTTYYIRPYATNEMGTSYGSVVAVTTESYIPTVTASVDGGGVTPTSATISCNVTSDGGAAVTVRGVCWGIVSGPTLSGSHTENGAGTGSFSCTLTDLTPNTTYYVRPYATNSVGTCYGGEITFTTPCWAVTVTISGETNVCEGGTTTLTANGASSYEWREGTSTTVIGESQSLVVSTSGTYHATGYDGYRCPGMSSKTVTVTSCAVVPTVTVDVDDDDVSSTTAVVTGNVTDDGGAPVTSYGFCWGTGTDPDITGTHTTHVPGAGGFSGSFSETLTGLSPNTTYCVRSYATNSEGISYGTVVCFTTPCWGVTVSITGETDICAGDNTTLTASGASTYEWRKGTISSDIIGTGETLNVNASGTYYVKGYDGYHCPGMNYKTVVVHVPHHGSVTMNVCPNELPYAWHGTSYSEAGNYTYSHTDNYGCLQVDTLHLVVVNCAVAPTVVISGGVENVTTTTASVICNVTSDGGSSVTARGIHISTNPYFNNYTTHASGSGTGSYTVDLTGLAPYTTYYVRAYATNGAGTSYSSVVQFTTATSLPVVTTSDPTNITGTVATLNGIISNSNNVTITAKGFQWKKTVGGSYTTVNVTNSTLSYNLTGLTVNTNYTYRAYVTTADDTIYGDELIFKTLSNQIAPTITTLPATVITQVTATLNATIINVDSVAITANGFEWKKTVNGTYTQVAGVITGSSLTTNLTDLTANTGYTYRAFITYGGNTYYGNELTFTTLKTPVDGQPCPVASTVTDYEGNVYNTVQIGMQCWMAQNLRSKKYANGNNVPPGNHSNSSVTPYYYEYLVYTSIPFVSRGYYYNWPAAMGGGSSSNAVPSGVQGVCPTGWHIPSDAEWTVLVNYVSCQSTYLCDDNRANIAKALASKNYWNNSTTYCDVGNTIGNNNATGFNAIPAASCYGTSNGYAAATAGDIGGFWSSTFYSGANSYYFYLSYNKSVVNHATGDKKVGRSVRCVCDQYSTITQTPTVTTTPATIITQASAMLNATSTNPSSETITEMGFEWKATVNGTYTQVVGEVVDNNYDFTYNLTGLTANTSYTYRAFITYGGNTYYGDEITFTTLEVEPCTIIYSHPAQNGTAYQGSGFNGANYGFETVVGNKINSVTDYDGNEYPVVQIGSQCWMAENMRCTHSPSTGTYVVNNQNPYGTIMTYTFTGKMARWYNNDSLTFAPLHYGLLYNWNAAVDTYNASYGELSINTVTSNRVNVTFSGNRQGICPLGWHVPSYSEWNTMIDFLRNNGYLCNSNSSSIAKVLASKENWTEYTDSSYPCFVGYNPSTNNITGFKGLPAGTCSSSFGDYGNVARFWSATQESGSYINLAYIYNLSYNSASLDGGGYQKSSGNSVRCIRDINDPSNTAQIPAVITGYAESLTETSATMNGTVTNPAYVTIVAKGFEYRAFDDTSYIQVSVIDTGNSFTSNLTNLSAGTEYTYRAFAIYNGNTVYGVERKFTTSGGITPTVNTVFPCSVTTAHPAQTGIAYKGNGFGGANYGLESVVNNKIYSITDYDGNEYPVVQIGSQCWMAENMRCAHSPNTGANIVNNQYISGSSLAYTFSGKMARWYNNSSSTYAPERYGLLYNWNAAVDIYNTSCGELSISTNIDDRVAVSFSGNRQGICPLGWHVPSNSDWNTMTDYLRNNGYLCNTNASSIAKALASIEEWTVYTNSDYPCDVGYNKSTNNITGFDALPVGICGSGFADKGNIARFWSATQESSSYIYLAYVNQLNYNSSNLNGGSYQKSSGCSVRCIRDADTSGSVAVDPTLTTFSATDITGFSATLNGTVSNPDHVTIDAQGFEWKVSSASSYTVVNATGDTMNYALTGLTANTKYTYRAFVTHNGNIFYGNEKEFLTLKPCTAPATHPAQTGSSYQGNGYNGANYGMETLNENGQIIFVTDYDGNVYPVVQIGSQCWLPENMRCTHSPSTGTYIVDNQFASGTSTAYTSTGKMARWYNNDSLAYASKRYGLLYNWNAAVDTFNTTYGELSVNTNSNNSVSKTFTVYRQGICPKGWHVPSDKEWNKMEQSVSGSSWQNSYGTKTGFRGSHAGKLAMGDDWLTSTTQGVPGNYSNGQRNNSGFGALPGGYFSSGFGDVGNYAYFWSSTQSGSYIYTRYLKYDYAGVSRSTSSSYIGISVRCLRDEYSPVIVSTSAATAITDSSATLNGTVTKPDYVTVEEQGFEWKAFNSSTYTVVNVTDETMSYELTGLSPNTLYTYRAFVAYGDMRDYGTEESFMTKVFSVKPCTIPDAQPAQIDDNFKHNGHNGANHGLETVREGKINSVTDYDGNEYPVVQIGSQCWLAENLRCTHSPSTGTYIVNNQFTSGTTIAYTYSGKMARWQGNDSLNNAPKHYGLLYNWNAVVDTFNKNYGELSINTSYTTNVYFTGNRQGICPKGWHVPSDAEWNTLEATVGGQDWQTSYETSTDYRGIYAGKFVTSEWNTNNITQNTTNAFPGNLTYIERNSSGLGVLAAGACYSNFSNVGSGTFFWTATQNNSSTAYNRSMYYNNTGVRRINNNAKPNGCSVRCLRDATIPTVTTGTAINVMGTSATMKGTYSCSNNEVLSAKGFEYKVSDSNNYTTLIGVGSDNEITQNISDLIANTNYTYRAWITCNGTTYYGGEMMFTTLAANNSLTPCAVPSTHPAQTGNNYLGTGYNGANYGLESVNDSDQINFVTDYDGNVYPVVQIGNQCWLAENMRCSHSPSTGTYIVNKQFSSGTNISYTYSGKMARWYFNDEATYSAKKYGLLYNWNAAVDTFNTSYGELNINTSSSNAVYKIYTGNRQGICPKGWHVPSDAEWNIMEATVSVSNWQTSYESTTGYRGTHAGRLAAGNDWYAVTTIGAPGDYNNEERNSSGFSALPGTMFSNSFSYMDGYNAYFWSTTLNTSSTARYRYLYNSEVGVSRSNGSVSNGFSVRCLRD